MTNIHVLIFSKDRALQLDATLRSLLAHTEESKIASLTVLYKTSSERFLNQYKQLIQEYPQIKFVEENDFREDLINIFSETYDSTIVRRRLIFYATLNRFWRLGQRSIAELVLKILVKLNIRLGKLPLSSWCAGQYWLFTVDDNLFIRPFNFEEIVHGLDKYPSAIGFSLRLGENIKYCYMRDTLQKTPEFMHDDHSPSIVSFEWTNAEHDFGYPLEISGTVYRSSLLVPLVASLYFTSPNVLESKLSSLSEWFARKYPKLMCYSSSVSFCVPLNKVQKDRPKNRSGNDAKYTIECLANLFDERKRIDVVAFSQFTPNACHQEVELSFIQKPERDEIIS